MSPKTKKKAIVYNMEEFMKAEHELMINFGQTAKKLKK